MGSYGGCGGGRGKPRVCAVNASTGWRRRHGLYGMLSRALRRRRRGLLGSPLGSSLSVIRFRSEPAHALLGSPLAVLPKVHGRRHFERSAMHPRESTHASRFTRVDPRTSHARWPCHCIIVRSASRRHDATVPNVAAQGTERILGMRPAQALVLMRTVAFLESRGCKFYRPHPCAKHESKSLKFFNGWHASMKRQRNTHTT